MKILKGISFVLLVGALTVSCKKEKESEINQDVQTENVIPANAKLETASLTIDGMTCAMGCAKTIEDKLAHTKGVKEVKVDFEGKVATVTFDVNQQNIASLTETIEAVAGGDSYKVTDSKVMTN